MAKKRFDVQQTLMKVGGLGVGAIGARAVGKIPFVQSLNPALQGGGKIVLGAIVSQFFGNDKTGMINNIGDGMIAIGAMELASNFVPQIAGITGAEDDNVYGIGLFDDEDYQVQGFDDTLNGTIAGNDEVSN